MRAEICFQHQMYHIKVWLPDDEQVYFAAHTVSECKRRCREYLANRGIKTPKFKEVTSFV